MGRAIEVDKRLDSLEHKINEVLLILDELGKTGSKQKKVDLHEEIETEKTNIKRDRDDNVKSSDANKRKSNGNNKNSKRSK